MQEVDWTPVAMGVFSLDRGASFPRAESTRDLDALFTHIAIWLPTGEHLLLHAASSKAQCQLVTMPHCDK
jgi:hypothetical protein